MNTDEIRQLIKRELPIQIKEDQELQELILKLSKNTFAPKRQTEDRFDQMLAELRKDRETQTKKWEENKKEFQQVHEEIMAMTKKHDRVVGSLGARWGIKSETTFRNALAGILEESFGVRVLHVDEYDDEGLVFGRPDQVELDVLIKNGLLILCELKSSIDKAGMYIFERKVRFYEKKHQRKVTRMMVISPLIDSRAMKVAQDLRIETYSDSLDVDPSL